MRTLKIGLPLLATVLGLAGCDRQRTVPFAEDATEQEAATAECAEGPGAFDTPEEPRNPKVFEAEDVAAYFNAKGEAEGIAVAYAESEGYWYLRYVGEESADASKDNLSLGVSSFLKYIPLYGAHEDGYLFTELSEYVDDPETYFVYVAVSSNWFAAASVYSYIEENRLITEVIIYDGRNGLYEEK